MGTVALQGRRASDIVKEKATHRQGLPAPFTAHLEAFPMPGGSQPPFVKLREIRRNAEEVVYAHSTKARVSAWVGLLAVAFIFTPLTAGFLVATVVLWTSGWPGPGVLWLGRVVFLAGSALLAVFAPALWRGALEGLTRVELHLDRGRREVTFTFTPLLGKRRQASFQAGQVAAVVLERMPWRYRRHYWDLSLQLVDGRRQEVDAGYEWDAVHKLAADLSEGLSVPLRGPAVAA